MSKAVKKVFYEPKASDLKKKVISQVTYKKGTVSNNIPQIIDILNEDGAFVEIMGHGQYDNGTEYTQVKLHFKTKKK